MNKNVGEDVSGWETRGQEKKHIIHYWFKNDYLDTYFKKNMWLQKIKQQKPKKSQKGPRRTKEEL